MTASKRTVPNVESLPHLLYAFLKSVSLMDVPDVIPLFTSHANVKDTVYPILGSSAVTA